MSYFVGVFIFASCMYILADIFGLFKKEDDFWDEYDDYSK